MKEPSQAMAVLNEEHARLMERRRMLDVAFDHTRRGEHTDALRIVLEVLERVTDAEQRVLRVHAECVSMLEHCAKVLALHESLRPVIIKMQRESESSSQDGGDRG